MPTPSKSSLTAILTAAGLVVEGDEFGWELVEARKHLRETDSRRRTKQMLRLVQS